MPAARATLYAATLAILVMAARSLLIRPPPLVVSCVACVAYSALVLVGAMALRLRMFVDAVVRGPKGRAASR